MFCKVGPGIVCCTEFVLSRDDNAVWKCNAYSNMTWMFPQFCLAEKYGEILCVHVGCYDNYLPLWGL